MKKVLDSQAKLDLLLGGESLVCEHSGKAFLVVGHQVCTHFGPLLFTESFLLPLDSSFHRFSIKPKSGVSLGII